MAVLVAVIVGILAGLGVGVLLCVALLRDRVRRWGERMSEDWRDRETDTIRSESMRRSEAVLRGRVSEQLAPTTDAFPFDPQDARLIGTPIDFVVFDGLAEARAGQRDSLRRIVLVEIKSGQSSLTTIQRRVRDAATDGRVSFHTLRRRVAGDE